jgi:dTDP-4-dehydrorhamnose 3,5-epimerase
MKFNATELPGLFTVELDPTTDERGFFARLYCPEEFAAAGHEFVPKQTSLSHNAAARTLRGLHYQSKPFEESKLIRVTRGRIYAVAVDLRPISETYLRWSATELSVENGRAFLIPHGFANGFITLEAKTDILYQIDQTYAPGSGNGIRWNDPGLRVEWPCAPDVISPRDATYPDFDLRRKGP